MKILVTGSSGNIGSQVVSDLATQDHAVVDYDLAAGSDILEPATLVEAMQGCDAVVHTAALLEIGYKHDRKLMAVNVQGTWNVLSAARENGVRRVVSISSVNALGVFRGERAPDYLPIDDAHPCYPSSPYGISKRVGEEMCRFFAASSDVSVVCLRPPMVVTDKLLAWLLARSAERPEAECDPLWEYGAFIDVRDVSQACICSLTCQVDRFACLLVSSADISTWSGRTSRELAASVLPDVPWRGGAEYEAEPYRSLVNIENARRTLAWTPIHSWQELAGRNARPEN